MLPTAARCEAERLLWPLFNLRGEVLLPAQLQPLSSVRLHGSFREMSFLSGMAANGSVASGPLLGGEAT